MTLSIFLALICFSLISAYAATLTVNLDNEDPTTLTAFVTGSAIPGTGAAEQGFKIDKSATFDNVNPGSYEIAIINENKQQVFTINIENLEQCDKVIASNDDDEICEVSLGTPIGRGSLDIKIGPSTEAFKTTQTAAELMSEDEQNDPPFRVCEAFEITDHLSTHVTKFIRSPSSAQYLIKASLSGEELKSLIEKMDTLMLVLQL